VAAYAPNVYACDAAYDFNTHFYPNHNSIVNVTLEPLSAGEFSVEKCYHFSNIPELILFARFLKEYFIKHFSLVINQCLLK